MNIRTERAPCNYGIPNTRPGFVVDPDRYLEGMSDEQRAAVLEPASRAIVLAGAGSGKTRVLVARLAHLLLQGLPPERLIAFSFTRKACAEITSRIEALLEIRSPRRLPPIAFTFNAFAFRLVQRHFRELGFSGRPRVLEEASGALLEAFGRFLETLRDRPAGSPRDLLLRLRPGPREILEPGLSSLEASFLAWKLEHGCLELSDQVGLALRLLGGPVGERVRRQYDAVLVDEFQDIDQAQQTLFEGLLGPRTRFMLFGDDDQAIYRWRGSEPELIRAHYRRTDIQRHLLTTNYRCREPILELASRVVAGDSARIAKVARAARTGGVKPRALAGPGQAAQLARVITEMHVAGRPLETMAVLVREHADAREVTRALDRAGVWVTGELVGEGVRLLTLHGSKGLEFPVVFLPFLDRGRFPNNRRLARERVALERRLKEARRAARSCRRLERSRAWLLHLDQVWPGSGWIARRLERIEKALEMRSSQAAWLPALEEATLSQPAEQAAALAEERRLCYVAMTRAKDELWLFCERKREGSEFLDGAGRLIEWEETKERTRAGSVGSPSPERPGAVIRHRPRPSQFSDRPDATSG